MSTFLLIIMLVATGCDDPLAFSDTLTVAEERTSSGVPRATQSPATGDGSAAAPSEADVSTTPDQPAPTLEGEEAAEEPTPIVDAVRQPEGPTVERAVAEADRTTFGADMVGPAAEPCSTSGTRITALDQVRGSGTFLLVGGTYGALTVPAGATVKPYNCQEVTIVGDVDLNDGSTVAGLSITADTGYVIRTNDDEVTVRNNVIRGGWTEAIRIYDGASNARVIGNDVDGGRDHHVIKVISENGTQHPDGVLIEGNRITRTHYGTAGEDLLQLEGHRYVAIVDNTFASNPRGEDGLDVKQGTQGMLVTGNRFEGDSIAHECLLVGGGHAANVVRDNWFGNCDAISLGASYNTTPWWRFQHNTVVDSQLRLRRSQDAEIVGNELVGGLLKLGISDSDDVPRNVRLSENVLRDVRIEDNTPYTVTCQNNVFEAVTGDALNCAAP